MTYRLAIILLSFALSPHLALAQDREKKDGEGDRQQGKRVFFRVKSNDEFRYQVSLGRGAGVREEAQGRREQPPRRGEDVELTYHLRVTDTSGGENTLEVTVQPAGAAEKPAPPRAALQERGKEEKKERDRQPRAQAPAQKFTVKLAHDGELKSVTPADSPGRGPQPRAEETLTLAEVKDHLKTMLGSGLHGQPLERGGVYILTSRKEGGAPAPGKGRGEEQGANEPAPRRDEPQRDPREPLAVASQVLDHLHLRLEGFVVEEDGEGARFTCLAPKRMLPAARLREMREQVRPGFPVGKEMLEHLELQEVGKARYRVEDGLLEQFSAEGEIAPAEKSPGQEPMTYRIRIRRMEAQARD